MKKLRTILNNDHNIGNANGEHVTVEGYMHALNILLDGKPGVFAQCVGHPDAVVYKTRVATSLAKYGRKVRVAADAIARLEKLGTDPLQLTIDACWKRGVLVVASYRMNSEDFYGDQLDMDDFSRAHKDWVIPGANCLDPAIPGVYKHRMAIFREVAESYDIDGIEFDFRRWTHMVSDPPKNYPVLTRMVAETRQMLDEVAKKKERKKMIFGVRVGPSLETPEAVAKYADSTSPGAEPSCKELGLDVKTWIDKGYVDYVCPSLFWPRLPGLPYTKEFVSLAKGTKVGIYPTVFPLSAWMAEGPGKGPIEVTDVEKLRRYRDDICNAALQCYTDGADGISTFNWVPYQLPGVVHKPMRVGWGDGAKKAQTVIYTKLGSPSALRRFLKEEDVLGEVK